MKSIVIVTTTIGVIGLMLWPWLKLYFELQSWYSYDCGVTAGALLVVAQMLNSSVVALYGRRVTVFLPLCLVASLLDGALICLAWAAATPWAIA